MDRGAWWATIHGVSKNQTQLGDFHLDFPFCKSLAIFSLLSCRVVVRIKCQGILYILYYYYLYLSKKMYLFRKKNHRKFLGPSFSIHRNVYRFHRGAICSKKKKNIVDYLCPMERRNVLRLGTDFIFNRMYLLRALIFFFLSLNSIRNLKPLLCFQSSLLFLFWVHNPKSHTP